MRNLYKLNLILLLFIGLVFCSGEPSSDGIKLFKFDFKNVATPYVVCIWVLLASLAKIGFHYSEFISSYIPESCMLIALGVPIGFIMKASGITDGGEIILTSDLFFFYLLPPIILDAGYFMPSTVFYLNIGTILLYAVLGTIFNAFAVGASLYAVADICHLENFTVLKGLLFGSLISAVDPVAVLAVFEEVHVHEILYMLVFGESVLNDAASVVLYRTFESLAAGTVDFEQVGLAFASFFIVSIGGTLIGVVFALLTSFITKYTEHVRVIEPAFVFLMAYMAYLSAEVFHFSGIMSILFCGIVMKPYVESNVSRKSHTTIKYFLKLLSSSCESIIFMFFGVSLVLQLDGDSFNWGFICFTLLFVTIYRAVGVITLTALANKFGRLTKVKKVEQFIMVYGGLRGAVAYSLAILLVLPDEDKLKDILITTTMVIVLFTTVIQGSTIKKLVGWLGVRKAPKDDKTMAQTLNERVMGYVTAGVEEIIGVHRHAYWRIKLEDWNRRYFRRWFERDPDLALDEEILAMQRKIAFKHALSYANNPSMITARESDEHQLTMVKRNASFALELAMKAQETNMECGILDINILSDRVASQQGEEDHSEAFNPRTIASIIPKARKTRKRSFAKRKYTLDSLGEREAFEDRYLKYKRNALAHMAPREANQSVRHRHHYNHGHHHKTRHRKNRKGQSKKPDMDTLPELTEGDDTVLDMRRISKNDLVGSEVCNSSSSSCSDDEDGGIIFSPKARGDTLLLQNEYIPALPLSDTPVHSNLYVTSAVLDDRCKNLSQRDFEDIREAAKWQHYPVSSQENSTEDMMGISDFQTNEEVTVEIHDPWKEPPPPYEQGINMPGSDEHGINIGKISDETTF